MNGKEEIFCQSWRLLCCVTCAKKRMKKNIFCLNLGGSINIDKISKGRISIPIQIWRQEWEMYLLAGRIGRRSPWRTARQPLRWDIPEKKNKKKYFDFIYFEFNSFFVFNFELCNISWPTTVAKVFSFSQGYEIIFWDFFHTMRQDLLPNPTPPSHPRALELLKEKSGTFLLATKSFIFRHATHMFMCVREPPNHTHTQHQKNKKQNKKKICIKLNKKTRRDFYERHRIFSLSSFLVKIYWLFALPPSLLLGWEKQNLWFRGIS
jgi:hypothetical protein